MPLCWTDQVPVAATLVLIWADAQPWFDLRAVWVIFSFDLVTQAVVFARVHYRGKWLDATV